jgi:hypothetical protein
MSIYKLFISSTFVLFAMQFFAGQSYGQAEIVKNGPVTYDFTFAELAIKYLETNDTGYLYKIAESNAARHIYNHAIKFKSDIPRDSPLELVKHLLLPIGEKRLLLPDFKRNLKYARDSIAGTGFVPRECLLYLPAGFEYKSTCLFFTFGYDLGVVIDGNASINLANSHYLKSMTEIKYYSVHELHHAGFVTLRDNFMPSLKISKYKEMANLIEYYTQMEGMAVYAALDVRKKDNALTTDNDYIALLDSSLMRAYEKEFFDIYFYFKKNPEAEITEADWNKLSILSDEKRLWYRVGALMAQVIDNGIDRKKLVSLITEPSEKFFNTYLTLRDNRTKQN